MKRIAIVQSNYIPWKGYFDLIAHVDEFILYDDAQYTKRDWRNRNQIKTQDGLLWLTVPVIVKGRFHQKIRDVRVADSRWAEAHWKAISLSQARARYFGEFSPAVEAFYRGVTPESLSEINLGLIRILCGILGIKTRLTTSMEYGVSGDNASHRLLDLCRKASANVYLSGPLAKDYLDEKIFATEGIAVEYFDYSGYPEYEQLYPPFTHFVSVLDLIFNEGPHAARFLKATAAAKAAENR